MKIKELIKILQQQPDKDLDVVVFNPFAFNEEKPHYSKAEIKQVKLKQVGESFSFPKEGDKTVTVILVSV